MGTHICSSAAAAHLIQTLIAQIWWRSIAYLLLELFACRFLDKRITYAREPLSTLRTCLTRDVIPSSLTSSLMQRVWRARILEKN
ncbi:unnamed protein product [Enterobius vermicularis]|uniref:Secreted protein n=1 Tax=Enterobius vermicularis TaxID=51028 RepID=A0A0N4UTP7_ENTVE|nr:unnamed protein product [Enterobius vermicularis]